MKCQEELFNLKLEFDLLKTLIEESDLPKTSSTIEESLASEPDDKANNLRFIIPESSLRLEELPEPFKISSFDGRKNGNWRRRCGCEPANSCSTSRGGKSYMQITSNVSNYDILTILVPHEYNDWTSIEKSPRQYRFFNSEGRYISNYYDGSGGGAWTNRGTIGFKVLIKGSERVHSYWICHPDFNTWGKDWLRCGIDYKLILNNS